MPTRTVHHDFTIDTDLERIDFATVHSWLTECYWSPGISLERVRRAAEGSSLVIGAYLQEQQVGYLRVVSDRTRFAWIADVYVMNAHRGRGIATAMVRFALADPEHQGLRMWLLATRDAHPVYRSAGFHPLTSPERFMSLTQETS